MTIAGPKYFTTALLVALLAVAGCDWFRDTPETRAKQYLETLVREPDNRERLDELATHAGSDGVLAGLGTQLAVEYLRARHRQGMALDFAVTAAQRTDPSHRSVRAAVATHPAGVRPDRDSRVRFEVALELSDQHDWRVTRVSAE